MEPIAWALAVASFIGYLIALQIGPSCASTVGPWAAGTFTVSFLWVAYLQEQKRGRRK